MVSADLEGRDDYRAGNAGALASGRLSPLLAVEIAFTGRAPANRRRTTCADPAYEHGEFSLGCAAHPPRTSQAWLLRSAINGRHVHGQATRAAQPRRAYP